MLDSPFFYVDAAGIERVAVRLSRQGGRRFDPPAGGEDLSPPRTANRSEDEIPASRTLKINKKEAI